MASGRLLSDSVLRLSSDDTVSLQALKKNASDEFQDSLRVIIKCIYSPSKYYAKVIHIVVSAFSFNPQVPHKV